MAGGILFPAGGVGGTGRASLRILPSGEERSLNLGGILRSRICLNGVKVVILPRRLLLVHEPGCLNRVRPLSWRFLRRYQGRRRTRRVKLRPPEQTPRLVSVAQRMGAPGQYRVSRDKVDKPNREALIVHGTVGKFVEIHLLIQVFTGCENLDRAGSAFGAVSVPKVIGGVFLCA